MWSELNYSKKAIRRAGDYLLSMPDQFDYDEFYQHFMVLENWRTSHAYPIQSMLTYFRAKAFNIDKKAVIVQRLKRTPSILAKLRREAGMKLDRMEDIGGCRIIVSNLSDVIEVRREIVSGRTRNILRRERDYIRNPKESGYRSIHLVYQYNGAKLQYRSHKVELQIRSKVQHSWATAVEVVGAFTGQALKASQGHDSWLNFFRSASIAFSDIENRKLARNVEAKERAELLKYIRRLGVLERLRAFAVTTRHLGQDKRHKSDYYLLILDIKQSRIQIRRFPPDKLEEASREYGSLETEFKDNEDKDVVLVSASSIHNLKSAYPNYFADTSDFVGYLERIIDADVKYRRKAKTD